MKMPQSWTKIMADAIEGKPEERLPKAKPVEAAASVEASLDMSAEVAGEGLCPECKKPMEDINIGDNQVKVCMADRITLPAKDPEAPAEDPKPEV